MHEKRMMGLRDQLNAAIKLKYGDSGFETVGKPPESASWIPKHVESTNEYFSKRTRVRTGLHSIMASEVLNFVDGKKSYWQIYQSVRGEALAAGYFFYGDVKYSDVEKLLNANVKSGALLLDKK